VIRLVTSGGGAGPAERAAASLRRRDREQGYLVELRMFSSFNRRGESHGSQNALLGASHARRHTLLYPLKRWRDTHRVTYPLSGPNAQTVSMRKGHLRPRPRSSQQLRFRLAARKKAWSAGRAAPAAHIFADHHRIAEGAARGRAPDYAEKVCAIIGKPIRARSRSPSARLASAIRSLCLRENFSPNLPGVA